MCLLLQLWEDKEGKKKMNKNNAKALSTLRQKIRKYNRDFETEIATYKEVSYYNNYNNNINNHNKIKIKGHPMDRRASSFILNVVNLSCK